MVITSFADDAISRIVIFEIGSDIQIGNTFSIEVFGVTRTYTVISQARYIDGNNEGNEHYHKYIF
jgi:hypothetical protein